MTYLNVKLPMLLAGSVLALSLAGCGHKSQSGGQVLARVNDQEITVLQVNAFLAQHPNANPDRHEAEQQALNDLVNQELLVQKAADLKLDQQPDVQQQIDLARREILATAAASQVLVPSVSAPVAADAHVFYLQHPTLFAERKLYDCTAFIIPTSMLSSALHQQLKNSHSATDTQELLDDSRIGFKQQQTRVQPEQVSPQILATLARMSPGDILTLPAGSNTTLLQLVQSERAPVTEGVATPGILTYLGRQRGNADINKKLLALKHDASVSYMRPFVDPDISTTGEDHHPQTGTKGLQ